MLQKSIVTVPDQGDIEIHHSSGNVYADLEFPDAEEMLAKARLVSQLEQIIRDRQWSRKQAAAVVGLSAPALSQVRRGHFHTYRVDEVSCWLNKARDAAQWQE